MCVSREREQWSSEANAINRLGADLKGSYPGDTRVWIEKRNQRVNVDSNGVILKGYDVVAYFTQHKPIKGSPNYKTNYQGATYYFSSAANLAVFERNPSKYVPQYGGLCANGVKKIGWMTAIQPSSAS